MFIPAVILNPRGLKNTPLPELHPRYSDAEGLGAPLGCPWGPQCISHSRAGTLTFRSCPVRCLLGGQAGLFKTAALVPGQASTGSQGASHLLKRKARRESEAGCATGCLRALGRQVIGMVKVRSVRRQLRSPQILPKPLTAVPCATGAKWRPQRGAGQGTVLSE